MSIKKNIIITSVLIISLLASINIPANVRGPGGPTSVSVSPATVAGLPLTSTFDIFVMVDNVKGMAAYSGSLTYSTLILTATAADAEYASPSGGICAVGCEDITPETITDSLGLVTWEVALTGFPTGFTGSGGLVKITLRVDADGTSPLTIVNDLIDTTFTSIPHTDSPGVYNPPQKLAPTAVLAPSGTVKITVGDTVNFDGSTSHDNNDPVQTIARYIYKVDGATVQDGATATFDYTPSSTGTFVVSLSVCNESTICSTNDASASVTVNPGKQAPTAVLTPPGPVKITLGDTVNFDGSTSHDNNSPAQPITSYAFTVNGAAAQTGATPTFDFTPDATGDYNVCLVVQNESSMPSGPDCTSVTANPAKQAPTAVLNPQGPVKITLGDTVSFDGSSSSDNNVPPQLLTTYTFTVNGGEVQTGSSQTFDFTPANTGDYTVCLVVVNESGMSSTQDCTTVTVNPVIVKQAPTALLTPVGPITISIGGTVSFDGSSSSDNNVPAQTLTTYTFTVNSAEAQSGSSSAFDFTPANAGGFTVCLVVVNESGMSSTEDCTSVTVTVPKVGPTAVLTPAGPVKITLGDTVPFDGSDSSDNNLPPQSLTSYDFSVNGAPGPSGASPFFDFTPANTGDYTVCLVVVNESGMSSGEDCTDVTVNPPSPVKHASTAVLSPSGPVKITLGDTVPFDGSSSFDTNDPVQQITAYTFTVDGVTAQTGASATFDFTPAAAGSYTVCLVVENESAMSSTADCTDVTVNPPVVKQAPTAVLTPAGPVTISIGDTVSFDGSSSSDNNVPPQQLTTYTFTVDGVEAQSGASAAFDFTPANTGDYTVCLVVVNESEMPSTEDCTSVTVIPPKASPTAVITPTTLKVNLGEKALFDGTDSFDNNSPPQAITRYTFSVNGVMVQDGSSPSFSFTATSPGTFTVSLVVCNDSGLCSNSADASLTVNPVKAAPTAAITASPSKIVIGQTSTISSSGSTDNSNPPQALVRYIFSVNGVQTQDGASSTFAFTGSVTGDFTISLVVCNTSLLCSNNTAEVTVTVNEGGGELSATLNLPLAAYATEPATFTININGGTPPYSCNLDFGDGNTTPVSPCSDGDTVSNVYGSAGTFTVTLTVTDSNGASATDTKNVTVQPEPRFIRGKLSWKHHLTQTTQTFSAKIINPSAYSAVITVTVDITMPDLSHATATGTFTLGPGASNTNALFTYDTSQLGKYCFAATLTYQVDANGDGIVDVTGTAPNTKGGCFNRV